MGTNTHFCPKVRWNPCPFLSGFPPEIAKNERWGGGEKKMKISMIEALIPAASSTKSN
jgi:hypothetical protein